MRVLPRGAINIASCVWRYINNQAANEHCKEFVFFSDNCAGQNKNKAIAGMYMHAVRTFNIDRISHHYLEPGQTQNERDSMHALVERTSKRVNVYTPMQWYTLAQSAKKTGNPYVVSEMEGHMKNFKELGDKYCNDTAIKVTRHKERLSHHCCHAGISSDVSEYWSTQGYRLICYHFQDAVIGSNIGNDVSKDWCT